MKTWWPVGFVTVRIQRLVAYFLLWELHGQSLLFCSKSFVADLIFSALRASWPIACFLGFFDAGWIERCQSFVIARWLLDELQNLYVCFAPLRFVVLGFFCYLGLAGCLVSAALTCWQITIEHLLCSFGFCSWFVLLFGTCLMNGVRCIDFFSCSTIFCSTAGAIRGKLQATLVSIFCLWI